MAEEEGSDNLSMAGMASILLPTRRAGFGNTLAKFLFPSQKKKKKKKLFVS